MKNELSTVAQMDVSDSLSLGNPSAFLFDANRMHALMQFAEMMSKAVVTVPKHLHGKPADCLAITLQSMRWRMDPFVVAGKTHLVNGNLGYEAQLVVAVLKNSGAVRGRPHYEYRGQDNSLECRAGFIPAGEESVVWTEWLNISGITTKNSPLWKVNPKQQFGYLQARNWARLYAPDALLGVYTDDELQATPMQPAERNMGAAEQVPTDPPALPAYPDDRFAENLPTWKGLVAEGRKSGAALVAMLSTKAVLSDAQRKQLLDLDNPPATPAPELTTEQSDFVGQMEGTEQ